jgi:hypothetical protein
MIPLSSIPTIIISFCTIIAALGLPPAVVSAEENNNDLTPKTTFSHLLDGKEFEGPTGEKGKKTHHIDVLSFKDGIFTSSMCYEYGFTGGPYTAAVVGDIIRFEAETLSPTHGKMSWKGTLKGDTMEVNYSWTKERWLWTTYREYWFKGTLQK